MLPESHATLTPLAYSILAELELGEAGHYELAHELDAAPFQVSAELQVLAGERLIACRDSRWSLTDAGAARMAARMAAR